VSKEKAPKGRREDIIKAALAAYSERGVFNTRIEEVAAAAGIGKGTVYEYFRSKEELMSAAIRYDMEELASQVKASVDRASSVHDKLKVMMETVMLRRRQSRYNGFDMNPASIGNSMEELRSLILEQNTKWQGWLEEIIESGVESGEIRRVDPQMFLGAIMGAVVNMVRPLCHIDWSDQDPAEAAERVTELFFEGIRQR
jgi:TetR/AcrR family fatty acid metabolism transcriptional regulator